MLDISYKDFIAPSDNENLEEVLHQVNKEDISIWLPNLLNEIAENAFTRGYEEAMDRWVR